METQPAIIFDLTVFLVEIVLALSSAYSAWMNLIQKQISKYGFDALVLLFFNKEKAKAIKGNPLLIKRMGIITHLVSIGAANESVSVFIQRIAPYFR